MAINDLPRSAQEIQAEKVQFDLGPFRDNFYEAQNLKIEFESAKKKWELYRDRLKARAGSATELVLDGVVVATHAISGAFNVAKLRKEQPHIHDQYLVDVTVKVFDEEAFAKDHPHLYNGDEFRARALRFKI
jgi:hypothetical protein